LLPTKKSGIGEITALLKKKKYPTNLPWYVFRYSTNFNDRIWLF